VIHPGLLPLQMDSAAGVHDDVPHRVRRPMDRDRKQTLEIRGGGPQLLDDLVHPVVWFLFQERHVATRSKGPQTTRESSRPAHQMGVVEMIVAAKGGLPPSPKTTPPIEAMAHNHSGRSGPRSRNGQRLTPGSAHGTDRVRSPTSWLRPETSTVSDACSATQSRRVSQLTSLIVLARSNTITLPLLP